MIVISSLCIPLANRLREISTELAVCTDEAQRKNLLAEQEVKRDLQERLLAAAHKVPRKKRVR